MDGKDSVVLPGARNVLHQDVAAAQKGDERELDLVVLAENDPLDVLDHARDLRRESFLHRAAYPSSLIPRLRLLSIRAS